MAAQRITDNRNLVIGYVDDRGSDIIVMNERSLPLGRYSKREDTTYDNRNIPIGRGNQLMRLL